MTFADWTQLIFLGCLWGGSFFFAHLAVAEIPPLVLVFYRVSIAALLLHVWLRAQHISVAPALEMTGPFLVLAMLNNVIPFSLIFLGQTQIGAGLASVLYATTPLWTVLVANAFTADEKLSLLKLIGIGLGIAGVILMIGPGLVAGAGGASWAKIAVLGASISYAFAVVYAKRFKRLSPSVVATGQLTASTAIMIPVVWFGHDLQAFTTSNLSVIASVGGLAVFSTALAFIIYFRLIATVGATNASLVTLIVPASAVLLGTLILGERLDAMEFSGMALIVGSLLVMDGRILARR